MHANKLAYFIRKLPFNIGGDIFKTHTHTQTPYANTYAQRPMQTLLFSLMFANP